MMYSRIKKYIHKHQLLKRNDIVIVALSGGADSVALLRILLDLGYSVVAAHCNFHLRGTESNRDEAFVRNLCKALGVTLKVQHFETESYAKENEISIEMAARELRYEWFERVRTECNAQCIATAHHKNDQAETLLLNLIRGTGLRGLAGIQPSTNHIIRPLLEIDKDEIISYLNSIEQQYVTDSTNDEAVYKRNKIRLEVIPLLQAINPSVIETLANTCETIRESIPFYQKEIKKTLIDVGATEERLPIKPLVEHENANTLLHEWLYGKGFNRAQKNEMINVHGNDSGKIWESSTHRVLKDRECFVIEEKEKQAEEVTLLYDLVEEITDVSPRYAYFDAELLQEPITIRPIKKGDYFYPFGMKGKKLVSDYLTDLKKNRFEKEKQRVACCGNDIIWVIGLRSDNRFRVTTETKKILRITQK